MELENEKEMKARFLSCGDRIINIDAIHRIEILWKDIVHPFNKYKSMRKGEPELSRIFIPLSIQLRKLKTSMWKSRTLCMILTLSV